MRMDPRQKRAYRLALSEVGTKEIAGPRHEPKVVQYFADAGESWVKDDETAWCGAFVGSILKRSGLPIIDKPLGAQNWKGWGEEVDLSDVEPGDIIVLRRGKPPTWKGHVAALHELETDAAGRVTGFMLVGGNQSNAVTVQRYPRRDKYGSRFISARRWPAAPGSTVTETARKAAEGAKQPGWIAAVIFAIIAALAALR